MNVRYDWTFESTAASVAVRWIEVVGSQRVSQWGVDSLAANLSWSCVVGVVHELFHLEPSLCGSKVRIVKQFCGWIPPSCCEEWFLEQGDVEFADQLCGDLVSEVEEDEH